MSWVPRASPRVYDCLPFPSQVHGSIYVNGAPMVAKEFRQQSAVVWQRDIVLSTATVREAIVTSALLKLPKTVTPAEKRRRADDVVAELASGLTGGELVGRVEGRGWGRALRRPDRRRRGSWAR